MQPNRVTRSINRLNYICGLEVMSLNYANINYLWVNIDHSHLRVINNNGLKNTLSMVCPSEIVGRDFWKSNQNKCVENIYHYGQL